MPDFITVITFLSETTVGVQKLRFAHAHAKSLVRYAVYTILRMRLCRLRKSDRTPRAENLFTNRKAKIQI